MTRIPQRKAATRRTASATARLQDRDRKKSRALFLERLEDRSLLAQMIWSGQGTTALWSNPQNWEGNLVPQQDDNLVFPATLTAGAGKTLFASTDDLAATRFRSITISDSATAYNITSNDPLVNKIALSGDGLAYTGTRTDSKFLVPISISNSVPFYSANLGAQLELGDLSLDGAQQLTFDGRGNFTVGTAGPGTTGVIRGTGSILKLGEGTVTFAKANTDEGQTELRHGVINVQNNSGLGDPTLGAGTFIGTGSAVQLQGNITVQENFIMRDLGVGFDISTMGAIR